MNRRIAVLDGPMGTELARRGVDLPGRAWSATANVTSPETVAAIHADYAAAGATVHTANTFRTTEAAVGRSWRSLAVAAVALTRRAVPDHHLVAGAIAPVEDCYRPDRSPPHCLDPHRRTADALAEAGVDLLLCETFPHPGEALAAVDAAVGTGIETWLALTAGPWADLIPPDRLARTAVRAQDRGATLVLVNCVAVARIAPFVAALARCGVPFGVYANAGDVADGIGWAPAPRGPTGPGPQRYAEAARRWADAGARVIGGCCGTTPDHVSAIATLEVSPSPNPT